jgi:TRAP-type mannitol/chloroaromatic compound transport system permease small subunit
METSNTAPPGSQGLAAAFIALTGRLVSWLTLLMVALTFAIVILRYGFNEGWIWLQESVTYLHALVFMVAAAWAFQTDDHVRVDIFYRGKSAGHQALVNLLGILLFLLPFCVFVLLIGWNYVAASWASMEGSREAGGLPAVFVLKSLILVMPALLLIQALTTAWASWRVCRSG